MLREDHIHSLFPILKSGLVYLDSAASSLTPEPVIEAMNAYYRGFRSNVHRGLYPESERATELYEATRVRVADWIHVPSPSEVIFTRGTTESLNLAARLLSQDFEAGDEILVSVYEHHSSLLPWQMMAREKGLHIRMLRPKGDAQMITADDVRDALTPRTRVLAITHTSNVTGITLPIAEIAAAAHEVGTLVVLDCAQSISHMPVDISALGVDAIAFSGHKMFGPTGVGVLWMRHALLEKVDPVFGGGGIVDTVEIDTSTWTEIPQRFEPGTPPIAEVIGLGVAIQLIQTEFGGFAAMQEHNTELYQYAVAALQRIPEIEICGLHHDLSQHHGSISFTIGGIHPHDLASFLGERRIAIRAGHHCAQPLMRHFGVTATARMSLHIINTVSDIDVAATALQDAIHTFRYSAT